MSYRGVASDPELMDNWVQKLGLLCEPKNRIGLLGSSYFIGIISSMLFVPALSDHIGRKIIFCGTIVVSIIGQIGLMYSHSLTTSTAERCMKIMVVSI